MNKRLRKCAEFVTKGGITADIGTDHGYLAIYLIENNISSHVYACDVNELPLSSAKKNISSHNLEEKITTILSDGLANVPPENITDVIIAGMGGELISQIVSNAKWLENSVNLILQPMTKAEFLREWLYENGFKICNENAIEDDGFNYTIINSRFSGEIKKIDLLTSVIGKIKPTTDDSIKYLNHVAKRMKTIANGLANSTEKKEEAQKYNDLSKEILSLRED